MGLELSNYLNRIPHGENQVRRLYGAIESARKPQLILFCEIVTHCVAQASLMSLLIQLPGN